MFHTCKAGEERTGRRESGLINKVICGLWPGLGGKKTSCRLPSVENNTVYDFDSGRLPLLVSINLLQVCCMPTW